METVFSPWVEFLGEHTAWEIWIMNQRRVFALALPIVDNAAPPRPSGLASD